jgi:hypothetical protein
LNSVTVNRNVVNNLLSSQNQQEDGGVCNDAVETQGVAVKKQEVVPLQEYLLMSKQEQAEHKIKPKKMFDMMQ